jgi:hypothetical protein
MTRAWIPVASFLVAACGGAPAVAVKPPPPPPQPISSLAVLEGNWRATDIDGWTYELVLRGGTFQQTIRRTTGGPCTQKGKLDTFEKLYGQPYVSPEQQRWMYEQGGAAYGAAQPPGPPAGTVLALVLTLDENTCNPDYYQGTQLIVLVSDVHTRDFTMRLGVGFGAEESHVYETNEPPPAKQS